MRVGACDASVAIGVGRWTDLGGEFKEQGLAKRDLYPVGIWVGVSLLHVALVWGASALWTRQTVTAPDIQWVQALPVEAPTRQPPVARGTPRLTVPAPAPVAAQSPPLRTEPRPESVPLKPVTEITAAPESRSEVRAPEVRVAEPSKAALAAPISPSPAAARQAVADLTPPSQSASYLQNPPPPYPLMSKRLGEQGRVVVRVFIDEQGLPKEAQLEVKSGYSRLDAAALDAVMSWRYVPAQRGGVPLAMWFNVPVTFDLKSNKE